ncbi:unnamed protein product [Durusdinium trenchii]|uniref:F-box domain-containing protein n=1 Tax=Durusdinium trenchii TaxID=1381693 RepID=A0ABP0QC70_9DINO
MACSGRLAEVLNEDALVRICRFLPAGPLLELGTTCADFHHRARHSKELWKELCAFLLGETTLLIHEANWSSSGAADFYQRLFRAAWRCEAFGTIPEYMYNLQCVSFSGGEKVCVFGGDVPTFEDEYERIQDRTCCFFVYVLELASCTWSAVKTTGSAPDWRSFHAAVGHTSFLDGKDYLITFGGTAEHCEPLAGGHLADMRGYQLDLHDFKWLGGPTENLPAPRLRFGAARYGRHLLIHGGHGGVLTSGNGYVARMNLHTLRWCQPTRWGRLNFSNAAPPLAAGAFETGTPEAGLVLGGAQQTLGGPRILQRLVVLRLRDVSVERDGELPEGESHVATGDGGDDEDDLTHVQLQIRNAQGRHRVVTMPMALLAALRRDTASAEGLLQLLQHLNQDREEPEPD